MIFLGEMIGLPDPPAFADPSTRGIRILRGVNYASAAGGILDETGKHYVCLIVDSMLSFLDYNTPFKRNGDH